MRPREGKNFSNKGTSLVYFIVKIDCKTNLLAKTTNNCLCSVIENIRNISLIIEILVSSCGIYIYKLSLSLAIVHGVRALSGLADPWAMGWQGLFGTAQPVLHPWVSAWLGWARQGCGRAGDSILRSSRAGTDSSRGAGMGSQAMGRMREVPGAWEEMLRLDDALKDLTDGEWNESVKVFFLFIPRLDRLCSDILKPSSVKRDTDKKGRGQRGEDFCCGWGCWNFPRAMLPLTFSARGWNINSKVHPFVDKLLKRE